MSKPRLFLLDGAAAAYRAYFAFIKNPMTNSSGLNTSAIFGFLNTLFMILRKEKPDYFAVIHDSEEPTFRHKRYKEYKATREKMPDDLSESWPYIAKVVKALNMPSLIMPGFEADDIIGTLVTKAQKENIQSFIVSGDKDFMQLIGPDVKMYNVKRADEMVVMDEKDVMAKFGVRPDQVVDVLALMGDASDNVPGVPGIGEKTASALIQEYDTLENLFKNLDKITKPKLKESLQKNRPLADLSKELVTIDCHVPIRESPGDLICGMPEMPVVRELFQELEFKNLLNRVNEYVEQLEEISGPLPKKNKKKNEPEEEKEKWVIQNPNPKYKTLLTPDEIEKALKEASRSKEVAVDTETTGLDALSAQIVGVSMSWKKGEAVYIPFNQQLSPDQLKDYLKPFLENSGIKKGGQNSKYDWEVFKTNGIRPQGFAFDTMIESYLLDSSNRQHNLDAMSLKHFNHVKIETEDLIGRGKKQISMRDVPVETITQYACEDADFTYRLHELFAPRILQEGLEKLYREVELPLVLVLADMERKGIAVDVELLGELSKEAGKELKALTKKIFKEAGEEFNIASPQQLGKILFDKMQVQKIKGIRAKKTKTGYATDVDVLEALQGVPIADLLLDYRQLSKLKNTYLDVLPTLVSSTDQRIHTSFNQTIAATGRLSSTDPNLQNIPIRSDFGRRIRKAFIPGDSRHVLISADYSQVELRVLAHMTGDSSLIETFNRNEDVHTRTASLIFGVSMDKVSPSQRSQAKTINFGVIYGMGPQRLARENGVSMAEAKKFIEEYFAKYPGIKKFTTQQVELAKTQGFVTTILGRKRQLPDIHSSNVGLRINAEHMAVNTPIQGSAADLIKVAMVKLQEKLLNKKMRTAMLLQVHDELVFESPKEEVDEAKKLIVDEMENAIKLKVPLRVDVGVGKSWLEAH